MVKSAFQNQFAQIATVNKPRSQFKRVSRHKATFDEGILIPFYLDDVIPGDTFNVKSSIFARLATPIHPIMDNMYLEVFWFFCPNRLVWDNFVKQHGERTNPNDSTDYTTPVLADPEDMAGLGTLWDNFGLPIAEGAEHLDKINAMPFRMYNLIYNDWFRDQDIEQSESVPTGDGPDPASIYGLKRIAKFKDYFTTARPAPQKGPSVEVPSTGIAPVQRVENADSWFTFNATTNTPGATGAVSQNTGVLLGNSLGISLDPNGGLEANLGETVGGPTVNAWREAIVIQQAYELDMRGGTRFIEMIFNHYGVVNPDFRLQRPEFLGYQKTMVNVHPIAQTSESDTTPQGNLAAFGTVGSSGNGFVKSFTEFGYVIGLLAVRSDISYQECVDRHWSRRTRFDYYYPQFANLGEQAILKQEIQIDTAGTQNEEVFGYAERWGEYRFKTSKVTGVFRSEAPESLDSWHLAQDFNGAPPALNTNFIRENAPVDRVIAVPDEPHFILDSMTENISSRVMPKYSTPGLTRF